MTDVLYHTVFGSLCNLFFMQYVVFLQRAAMLALQALYIATAIPSVCLSVRLSRRYCVKQTTRSTVQFLVADIKMYLVL